MYHEQFGYNIEVASDTIPTKLSVPYDSSSTAPITVDNIGILHLLKMFQLLQQIPDILKSKMRL